MTDAFKPSYNISMRDKRGPWIRIASRVAYKTPWTTVREDRVIKPDGKPGIFSVVQFKSGVRVLALDEKQNVYLVKEYKYAVGRYSLELPTGGIDAKETKLKAAKRELEEETGLKAKRWTYLGKIDPFTNQVNSPAYLYMARGLFAGTMNWESTEKIETVKIPLRKAICLAETSKITHAQSVVLLLKAKYFL